MLVLTFWTSLERDTNIGLLIDNSSLGTLTTSHTLPRADGVGGGGQAEPRAGLELGSLGGSERGHNIGYNMLVFNQVYSPLQERGRAWKILITCWTWLDDLTTAREVAIAVNFEHSCGDPFNICFIYCLDCLAVKVGK